MTYLRIQDVEMRIFGINYSITSEKNIILVIIISNNLLEICVEKVFSSSWNTIL